jgi:hypothetical protein
MAPHSMGAFWGESGFKMSRPFLISMGAVSIVDQLSAFTGISRCAPWLKVGQLAGQFSRPECSRKRTRKPTDDCSKTKEKPDSELPLSGQVLQMSVREERTNT